MIGESSVMSSASGIHDRDFENLLLQQDMDFQHSRGNILGWQPSKRQHSPSVENRQIKKRYGTENISPELWSSKDNLPKTINGSSQNTKRYLSNKYPIKGQAKTTDIEPIKEQEKHKEKDKDAPVTIDITETDFDMDDIIPLDMNLSKTAMKYCDDRVYVDLACSNGIIKAEPLSRDSSRQANENFREKIRKPLKELLDIFDIRTDEEPLQYILVGLKLQLLGKKMTKFDGK